MLEEDEQEMSVVITNPQLPDNPMIYVSDQFEDQTGFAVGEVLGRNCRMLQGPGTNASAIALIREGLKAQTRFSVDILNYRKDGTPFLNRLRVRPLFDENGELIYFVGVQNPV